PHTSTLFPYTTLFRSPGRAGRILRLRGALRGEVRQPGDPSGRPDAEPRRATDQGLHGSPRLPRLRRDVPDELALLGRTDAGVREDRKSTRLNSSHQII